ncbi:adhesion G protein-coupled receptor L3-like isoform X2 [Haliotis rufescens]|uniref:adhesion G protein-coupled receptor L3-like isoform X2 n=1 Tax=Haliotis rufescens TaxID=6454 RepID=UPI001EB08106|nr:adhesion G protein-coupled receptor L3-like isoform X2 [Haliotis rufescens]
MVCGEVRGMGRHLGALVITAVVICQLAAAVPGSFFGGRLPPRKEWKTTYACENSKLHVECNEDEVIRIMLANYGRYSISVCNRYGVTEGWNLQCISVLSFRVVSERCDGRRQCEMMANNNVFGDPCPDTSKYAEVKYYCQPVDTPKPPSPPTSATTSSTTQSTIPTEPSRNNTRKPTLPPAEISSGRETTLPPRPPTTNRPYNIRVCKTVRAEGVLWPTTLIGRWAKAACPGELIGTARWLCSERGWVGGPDLSECVSPWVKTIDASIDEVLQGDASSQEVMTMLENVTEREINAGDLKRTTQKLLPKLNQALRTEMEAAQDVPVAIRRKKIKKFAQTFVNTSSNLLSRKQKKSWDLLPKSQSQEAATSLIISVEKSAFHVAEVMEVNDASTMVSENLVLEVNVKNVLGGIEPMTFPSKEVKEDASWNKRSNHISIPARSLVNAAKKGVVTVVFVVYNNLEQFMQPRMQSEDQPEKEVRGRSTSDMSNEIIVTSPEEEEKEKKKEKVVNSNIISASINNREEVKLFEPVEYTMQHLNPEVKSNPLCSYWKMDDSQKRGQWSQDGCSMIQTNDTHTTCKCNHLTNFAVLMDITGTKLSPGHILSLRIITLVGCIISIICLLLTWITFVAFKNLQCDRTTIHKHLVYSLMLAEIIFVVGIGQTDLKILCSIIAGLLHFLFLVAFAWMCLEGVQLYVMLIEVFETERSRLKWYYLFGYGVPLMIVAISAAVYHQGYGTEAHCWINTKNHFIWSFVGPALFVMTVNVAMLSIAIYMMCKHANTANSLKEKSKLQKLRAWIKGSLVLVVLLGLTWSFGILFLNQESVAMAYIFTILNSLQGAFIFIFHCIMNEKVQKEYRKIARRTTWLPKCIRVNFGGYNGHLSSSPNQSSGSGHNYFSRLFPGRRRNRSPSASTNSSTKPFLSSKGHRQSLTVSSTSRESSLYPSTINGYVYTANNNDPHKSPTSNGKGFTPLSPCFENGGIAGDLSEVIDCSVIDSEAVTEYCHNNLQVCEEKKRYSSGSEDFKPVEEIEHDRLSALSYNSVAKNRDSFISDTDEDGNSETGFTGDMERNLINRLVVPGSRKNGVSKVRKQSPSLGNINDCKVDPQQDKVNSSTPNLKYKDSKGKAGVVKDASSVVQHSMPDLSSKAGGESTTANGHVEPLTFVNTKSKVKRLSSDIQIRFDPHRFDLSSTDC